MKPILIRADAGGQIGTGHIMRMIALAQAYQRRGGRAIIASSSCPEAVSQRATDLEIEHQSLSSNRPGSPEDAEETLLLAQKLDASWVVLDGYHFPLSYQEIFKDDPCKLLCTDDHGYSDKWCCDALLNQNLDSNLAPHGEHELENPQLLLGSSFSLLREEFLAQPIAPRPWTSLKKILISMGGADPHNATKAVLDLLDQASAEPLTIRVLAGAANPHLAKLRAHLSDHTIEIVVNAQDMPTQLSWADGIISAGGSTCWEWLHAGLPGAIVTIADNQVPIVQALTGTRKAALALGWPDHFSSTTNLSAWLANPASVIKKSATEGIIDGRGADRVACLLDGSLCLIRHTDPITDLQFTFDLVNQPSVRGAGYSTGAITRDTHLAWLDRHCNSPESHLFVAETLEGQSIGLLRFHRNESAWEIGIALTPESRGRGFGWHIVNLGMRELASRHQISQFVATIKPANSASKNLFKRLGFEHQSTEGDRETWTFQLS